MSCDKVSNATDCVTSNSNSTLLKYIPVGELTTNSMANNVSLCVKIAFNSVCVNVDFAAWTNYFDNVTISITVDRITIFSFETTIPNLAADGGVCLDDYTVLEILLLIPSLRDYALIIMKILEATGCEPRGLFSLCFYFTPCAASSVTDVALPCGCFSLSFQLLYWRDYCVVSEYANIGCIA